MKQNIEPITSLTSVAFATISWAEVNAVLSVIASTISIAIAILTLVSMLVKWFKKATEDGKITADEIVELGDTIKDGVDNLKKEVEKTKKGQKE